MVLVFYHSSVFIQKKYNMIIIDKLILSFDVSQFKAIEARLNYSINDFAFDDFIALQGAYHQFNRTKLQRIDLRDIKTHFRENYWVFVDNNKIGKLQWLTNGTSAKYGYLTLCNHTFYNGDWKLYKQAIMDLSLTIHNVTRLDIAYDSDINPTKRYFQIINDRENEIVINGVRIKDRKKLLDSPYFLSYGSLDLPFSNPQIHFATKDKSTTCRTYNKTLEIETSSNKTYILESYDNIIKGFESDIYRCEVSLSSKVLSRIADNDLNKFLERLEDEGYLLALHRESMMRLFRYSKKGKRKTLLSYYKH